MLNSKELLSIITGEILPENIQQHGIDLNVTKIERLERRGFIPKEGKTTLPQYIEVKLEENNTWILHPGMYNVEFSQGCKVPPDQMLLIRQRSSLARCGGLIHSSVFDAGFETNNIGTMMTIIHPLVIEKGARIAQIYNHNCTAVENDSLYNGQWQSDKQRVV